MKLLISTYACAPNRGSDHAVGWNCTTAPLLISARRKFRSAQELHAARSEPATRNIVRFRHGAILSGFAPGVGVQMRLGRETAPALPIPTLCEGIRLADGLLAAERHDLLQLLR